MTRVRRILLAIFCTLYSQILLSEGKLWYIVNGSLYTETAQQACEILEAKISPGTLGEIKTYSLGEVANNQVAACELGTLYGNKFFPISGRLEKYILFDPLFTSSNKCSTTVGDPIDPVSGSNLQKVELIKPEGINRIAFTYYYDSLKKKHWHHNYERTVIFTLDKIDSARYNFSNIYLVDPAFDTKDHSFIDVKPTGNIPKGKLPPNVSAINASSSPEKACANWLNFKTNYSFDWIDTLHTTSLYIGNGKCEIRADDKVKMVLGIL